MPDLSALPRYWRVDDPGAAGANDFLGQLQQIDPNAQYVLRQDMLGGDDPKVSGNPYYQLSFNPSLLPTMPLGGGGAANYQATNVYGSPGAEWQGPNWVSASPYAEDILNPNLVQYDPVYGNWTTYGNLRPDNSRSWLDWAGPAAVAAFGFGIPAIAAGLTGGAIGGAAGSVGMPWWGNAGLNTVRQVGSGNINPLALGTSWAPGLTEFGVPSEVAQGLQYGGKAYGAYEQTQQPRTELTYNPQNYGKLNRPLADQNQDNQPVATLYTGDTPYLRRGGGV